MMCASVTKATATMMMRNGSWQRVITRLTTIGPFVMRCKTVLRNQFMIIVRSE